MGRASILLRNAASIHRRSFSVRPSPILARVRRLGRIRAVVHSFADPNKRPVKLSATIITLNEERNIARVIESLRCVDEIVVVDSGSTDRTVEIAEKLGARVVESPWPGYANQKNLAADRA